MPGPAPKREEERRRRNKDVVPTETVNLENLILDEIEIPVPDENWEPLVISMWESLTKSGQAIFYEPSDWMSAYALMEILDRWLKPQDVKVGQEGSLRDESGGGDITYVFEPKIVAMPAGVISAIYKALGDLMVMEGPRRKLRIELERKRARDAAIEGLASVTSITATRDEAFKRARESTPQEA